MANEDWDAIVIGSGLGGLTAAAYLTTNGLRTLVLEQYDVAGGSSHVFRRKNSWEFDVGVHYLGDCGPTGAIPMVLRGLGLEGKIDFLRMDPDGFDTLVFPGLLFRVPKGWDRYLDRLVATFPNEKKGLERCVSTLQKIATEILRGGFSDKPLDLLRFAIKSPNVLRWSRHPLGDLFDICKLSQQARAVLVGESGDYAVPPSRASVLMHAILMDHYLRDGAFYPKGGGQIIAAYLVDVVRSHGGDVRTRARAEKILVERGQAIGVRLRSGEELRASVVISNADLKQTFLGLVGPEHLSSRTAKRVGGYRMAMPTFSVYLGLDVDLRDHMPNTNYWVHRSFDPESPYRECRAGRFPDKPPCFMTSASVKDPHTAAIAPDGCSSLEVMTLAPPHYSFWGVTDGPVAGEKYSRYPEYRALKERMTDALVDAADRTIPGIKDHVVWKEASTPITHERYTLASGGTSYGIEHSVDQSGLKRPRPKTEIEGLYLAGASTVFGHGIAGVMFGGVGCASAVLGRDLKGEVEAGRVLGDPTKLSAGGPGWDPLEACRRLSKRPTQPRPSKATEKEQDRKSEPSMA